MNPDDDKDFKSLFDALAALVSKLGNGQSSSAIGDFLKFLFGDFLGLTPDSQQQGDGDTPPDSSPEQPLGERIRLGKMVLDSGAITKWADYKQQHEGEQVQFASPVEGRAQVTSKFGHRDAPMKGASTEHKGVDIGARGSDKTPRILAAADGIVLFAGPARGYGNAIIIGHKDGTQTLYGHLSNIDVSIGQSVDQSQPIGVMGNEGISTAPHLHFEHRSGNAAIAPEVNGRRLAKGDALQSGTALASLVDPSKHPKLSVSNGTPVAVVFNGHPPKAAHTRG